MDLVETVARAIWKQIEGDNYPWDRLSPEGKAAFKRDAMVAITETLEALEAWEGIGDRIDVDSQSIAEKFAEDKGLDFFLKNKTNQPFREETKGSV